MNLDELLFYTFPGGILLGGILIAFPVLRESGHTALLIASVPVLGFVLHSFERVVFDVGGGYFRTYREVIKELHEYFSRDLKPDELLKQWDMYRYSDDFPAKLAQHTKRTWHFAHGLCSCTYAASSSAILVGMKLFYAGSKNALPYNTSDVILMKIGYIGFLLGGLVIWGNLMYLCEEIRQLETSMFNHLWRKKGVHENPSFSWREEMKKLRGKHFNCTCRMWGWIISIAFIELSPFVVWALRQSSLRLFVALPGLGFVAFCMALSRWRPRVLCSPRDGKGE